jgi:glycosyltransferase involved in cell wall biosynthesis
MVRNKTPLFWTKFRKCDISIIVNAHRERLFCIPSVYSADAAATKARAAGLKVELIVALDCADDTTREVVQAFQRNDVVDVVLDLKVDDLGSARNTSVGEARGRWVAFLDADDLWSEDWLIAAHQNGERERRVAVWHPEINIYFGEQWRVFRHVDMDEPNFAISRLAMQNYWTSLSFTLKSLLTAVPYPTTDLSNQIGYEDWSWNMRTIDAGAVHKIVPGTSHGIRVKQGSLVHRTVAANAVPAPSLLFRRILTERRERSPVVSPF